jgi:K+-sensing histidine kinase KdpD
MNQAMRAGAFRKFGVIAVAVVVATLLTFPLAARTIHSRDLLFIVAVFLVSRYEGTIAGICVAFLSVGAFDWYFDQTPHVLDVTFGNIVRLIVFVSLSVMIALLDRQRRRATGDLATSNRALRKALDEIKTLRGLLPICSYCKRIQTGPETWVEVENYIRKHSEAEFSHGVCPDCLRKFFPDTVKI